MSKRAKAASRRGGFTLPEILVAVAMVGVLAAVTLPAVMSQVNKSEVSRIVQDLQNLSNAAQVYRTDTGAWPSAVTDLVTSSVTGWSGPYIARTSTGSIQTGTGGIIADAISQAQPTGATNNFLRFDVTSLTNADAISVDAQIDAGITGDWWSTGLVQATGSDADFIRYYPVAIK